MKTLKFHKFDEIYEVPYGANLGEFITNSFRPSGDFYSILDMPGSGSGYIFAAPKGFDLESASTGIFIDTPSGPRELINGTEIQYRQSPGTVKIVTISDPKILRDSSFWESYVSDPKYINSVGCYIFRHIWLKTSGNTTPWQSTRDSMISQNGTYIVLTPDAEIAGGLTNYIRIGHGVRIVENNGIRYQEIALYDIIVDGVTVYHQDPAESFPDHNYYLPRSFTNIEIRVRLTAKQL